MERRKSREEEKRRGGIRNKKRKRICPDLQTPQDVCNVMGDSFGGGT